jgi:hypothetical protein
VESIEKLKYKIDRYGLQTEVSRMPKPKKKKSGDLDLVSDDPDDESAEEDDEDRW